jgi:hypothetical protein
MLRCMVDALVRGVGALTALDRRVIDRLGCLVDERLAPTVERLQQQARRLLTRRR